MTGTHVAKLALLPWLCGYLGPRLWGSILGYVVHYSVDQVIAEALTEEVVEDGIGDTVEEGQALDYTEGEIEKLHCIAAEDERV